MITLQVRNITTPMGRTNISDLDQLQHLGRYVASSSNPPKGVDLDKIQEKYSATQRREPQRTTAGGHSYWMPTTPTLPNRVNASRILRALNLISAKQVFFVLNGKGKFYRSLINPMKMPSMEQLLEECSSHLEVAIHRLYTPEGKLITTVEEILAYDGPRIIACPRNERPLVHEKSGSNTVKLPEIHPTRYAPRQPYQKTVSDATKSSTGGSGGAGTSGSSSGNSIEKSAASTAPKDSGTGTSINSQQSDRPASMTEKKAQMIRDELRANLRKQIEQNSSSEHYSEEDMIREEESDYDHVGAGPGIQSGTSDEENETTSKLGKRKKSSKKSNGSSNRTPAHMTPSTAGSGKLSRGSGEKRLKTMSRQDTPYHETPSRQNTGDAASTSSEPKSTLSSRTSTASKAIQELSDDEDEKQGMNVDGERFQEENDDSEEEDTDDDDDSARNTPAIHTPDTRQPTAKSRLSHAGSVRSFDSDSSRAWSRISGYSDKEIILPSDEEEDPYLAYRDIGTAERERLGEAATKIQKAYKKYNEKKKKVQFEREKEKQEERERREYEEKQQQYKIEIVIGNRFGADFDTPLFVVLHGENGSSEKMYSRQKSWLFSIIDFYTERAEDEDMNEGRLMKNKQMEICITRTIMGLGQLTSIDVGHEREGYGAGTFIDKIFVTEEGKTTGRRFVFQVEKWFDSGQTDGLLERNIKLNGLLYLEAPVVKKRASKGRWEFRLHTMQSDLGGTTSNIILYGYGMNDYCAYSIKNDSLLRDPYSVSLIQIDFGTDIGSLRKVRIEIDGAGDKPNFYLEYVEAQDLDTKERCVLMFRVHNWLLVEANHGHRKWQNFREFPILSKTYDPLIARTYEGTVTLADKSLTISEEDPIYLQCFSEAIDENDIALDSSGQFPVVPTKMKNGNIHFTYKVDVVTNGHYPRIRIIPKNTKLGHDVLDGMALLEEIYDDMISHVHIDKDAFKLGQDLFIEEIQLKCGENFPHFMQYINANYDYERNHKDGPYFKQMLPIKHSDPSSSSTERKWKKSEARPVEEMSHWELLMSVDCRYGIVDRPTVVLVANDGRTFEMENLNGVFEQDDNVFLRYTLSAPNFGNPLKCRVSLEETTPMVVTRVIKMILNEVNTKTQVFFKVNKEILEYDTEELTCIYPDVGVYSMKEYEVHITTLEGGGSFRPYINIHGDNGDTGYRAFPGARNMNSNPVSELLLAAVDLKTLRTIEVWAKTGEPESWKGSIKIVENNALEYESGLLELSMNGQIAYSQLEFKRAIESFMSEGSDDEDEGEEESGEAEI
ncbi:hypothetical protein CAEBREN_29075 [Caenorhabditis brenneri]|uniref:Doublecortin domain-containing protein n=1 Tax=Caenorhabditis brenneri TaxID=135651 RepID=G0NKA6_CAEBE|nr:hypothetical protein CAEBREN_29075 [Caenorhabditis brenneri]